MDIDIGAGFLSVNLQAKFVVLFPLYVDVKKRNPTTFFKLSRELDIFMMVVEDR